MTTEHSPFPSDETLAAFIDGTLDEQTRERVMEHMAGCSECLDQIIDTTNDVRQSAVEPAAEPELAPVVPIHRNRYVVIGLAAAAVLVIVVLTPYLWPRSDMRALAKVVPPERLSDGRITGFPYQKRAARYRGLEDTDVAMKPEYWPFLEVASRVEEKATKHPDAKTVHALGVAFLEEGQADKAAKTLEDALMLETKQTTVDRAVGSSTNPQLLSDLAAAYIAQNRYDEALRAAERAWSLAKTPEIAWNRATAAEGLQHNDQALRYWRDYLQLDRKSQWAADAQAEILKLSAAAR